LSDNNNFYNKMTNRDRYFRISFMIIILFASVQISAQEFKKTATSGFVFLHIPADARDAALGESSIALTDLKANALFKNPAGLGFLNEEHSFSVSYSPWFADIKNYSSAYAYNSSLGVFALGLVIMDYGEMPRTIVESGQKVYSVVGSFNADAFALGLSYSKMLTDKFSFGVTIKYVRESIYLYSADNILFDGGVLYFTGLSSLRIAASIQNFGVDSKFINDQFKMPAILRLGAAAEIIGSLDSEYRVTLIAEALHPNDAEERLNLGTELSWRNMITLRGGYKFFYDEESYSFGIGFNPRINFPLAFDYSFSDYGRLGNVSRVSLQIGF